MDSDKALTDALADLLADGEEPLYSVYVWIVTNQAPRLQMSDFLKAVDREIRAQSLLLFVVDRQGHKKALTTVPHELAERYVREVALSSDYDPFGLSLAAAAQQPLPWQLDVDHERGTFVLESRDDEAAAALAGVQRVNPLTVFIPTSTRREGSITTIAGRIEKRFARAD